MSTHLQDRAFELLTSSKEERIYYINEDKWIGYERAKSILERLEDLICYPKTERMPNLLIVGDSNNGKTQILRRFESRYPMGIDEETYINTQPVIYITAPSKPDENAFFIRLLEDMCVPYAKNDSVATKRERAIRTMKVRGTKLLIIDEIQHIIAGTYNSQKNFLNGLKDLSNTLQIPLVVAGIEDAFNAIKVDPQLENRFQIEVLERWRFEDKESRKNIARLLMSIESRLPLPEPSFLYKKPMIEEINYLSEGLIGEMVSVTKKLAIYAVKNDAPCITLDMIKKLDIQPPSKRHSVLKRRLR